METLVRVQRKSVRFTPAQLLVIRKIVEGKKDKEIAEEMNLSIHAVTSYGKVIYSKLGLHSRTQVAVWAVRNLGM